jgi:hypothetical protein
MQFYQLAIGARFEFGGRQRQKVAMSMAEDTDRNGTRFGPLWGVHEDETKLSS